MFSPEYEIETDFSDVKLTDKISKKFEKLLSKYIFHSIIK